MEEVKKHVRLSSIGRLWEEAPLLPNSAGPPSPTTPTITSNDFIHHSKAVPFDSVAHDLECGSGRQSPSNSSSSGSLGDDRRSRGGATLPRLSLTSVLLWLAWTIVAASLGGAVLQKRGEAASDAAAEAARSNVTEIVKLPVVQQLQTCLSTLNLSVQHDPVMRSTNYTTRQAFMMVFADDGKGRTVEDYYVALRVLLHRLLHDGKTRVRRPEIDVVVLYTEGVTERQIKAIKADGAIAKKVDAYHFTTAQERWTSAWTKLRVFEQTEYDKIVFLDNDYLPLTNIDYLMDITDSTQAEAVTRGKLKSLPEDMPGYPFTFIAAYDPWPWEGPHDWKSEMFNSGMFITSPKTMQFHLKGLLKMLPNHEAYSYDWGDQGLLNRYFHRNGKFPWGRIGLEHNVKHPTYVDVFHANAIHFRAWADNPGHELAREFWGTAGQVQLLDATVLGRGESRQALTDLLGDRNLPLLRNAGRELELERLLACREPIVAGRPNPPPCPHPAILMALGVTKDIPTVTLVGALDRARKATDRNLARWMGGERKDQLDQGWNGGL